MSPSSVSVISDKLSHWQHGLLAQLPNITTTCLILQLFYITAKGGKWLFYISLKKRHRPALALRAPHKSALINQHHILVGFGNNSRLRRS